MAGENAMKQYFGLFILSSALAAQTQPASLQWNQAGYLPGAPKIAVFASAEPAKEFRVVDARSGKMAFQGRAGASVLEPLSGDAVQALDFSKLTKPGRYAIEVGGARSGAFEIGPAVYRRPLYLAMRSFYGQRCGTAVDMGPEFPGYKYEACHIKGAWHASSGKTGERPSVKGWHDAGDYGRYVVNSGITTGTLLWAWELYQPRLGLDIPESKNRTPDFLDEIRWNLDWMLSMQDNDGGVFHKQTTERFSGFVMPQEDTMPSVVIGTGAPAYKGTCATADFAAVMAIGARVYAPHDQAFAGQARAAAEAAWKWAEQNPHVLFRNPEGVNTGAYGDRSCADEMLWAAAELHRTTGGEDYRRYFDAHYAEFRKAAGEPPSWPSVAALGLWTRWLGAPGQAADIREWTLEGAAAVRARVDGNGYRIAMRPEDYVWGSNAVAANYGLLLLIAHRMEPAAGYREAAMDHLHYLLGRNTFSVSWVTHVGMNWYKRPHHRPSGADKLAEPWPGMLSGGPNRRVQDAAMKKLPAGLPPMKMWVDEQESYATNEMAINWNAALVFLLAGLQ